MLGGSGSLNAMQYLRGFPRDYDTWEELGNPGWNYAAVKRVFERMENNQELNRTQGEPILNGPIKLNYFFNSEPRDPLIDVMLEAVTEKGYSVVGDFNDGRENLGYSSIYGNLADGLRQSSARAYFIPAGKRPNLHVMKNALVTQLIIQGDLVQGVEFMRDGQMYQVNAGREVILSGGTIGSAQILMLSGVGPRQHLEEIGIPVVKDVPVGQNLQDHVLVSLHFKFSEFAEELPSGTNLDNAYRYLKDRSGPLGTTPFGLMGFINTQQVNASSSNIQAIHGFYPRGSSEILQQFYGNRRYNQTFIDQLIESNRDTSISEFSVILCNPESRGELKLRDNSPLSKPLLDANYFNTTSDFKTIVEALKIYQDLETTQAFRGAGGQFIQFAGMECGNYPTDEYWECYARQLTTTIYHQVGTVKMGPDSDPGAVVDEKLRVKGLYNLRVCDASIMPMIVSVNTNAASMMIGERCADFLKEL